MNSVEICADRLRGNPVFERAVSDAIDLTVANGRARDSLSALVADSIEQDATYAVQFEAATRILAKIRSRNGGAP